MDRKLESKVFEIVAGLTGGDVSELSRSTALVADLRIDSAGGLLLLVELEDAFDVTISDTAAGRMLTVGDIVDYLEVTKADSA
jgi:acyl carrier protein